MVKNMKKTTIVKILIFVLLYILLVLSLVILFQKNQEITKEDWTLYRLEEIQNPQQIFYFNNSFLFKKDSRIKKLNIEQRNLEDFLEIQENEILAEYKGQLVFVSYENHVITSPEENATDIEIQNLQREVIFSKSFHETIMPLYLEDEFLFLIDNYLNSPERTYRVDLQSGEIEFFQIKENLKLQGDEKIEILDSKDNVLLTIPKMNDITSFSANENLDQTVLVDMEGNVWIYFKKSK